MKKVIIALVLATGILSCGRKTVECPVESFRINFVGYDSSEVESIMRYRYTKGSNFTSLIDSSLLVLGTNGFRSDDSTFSFIGLNAYDPTNTSNQGTTPCDFKLKNLFDQNMISISDVQHEIKTTSNGVLSDVGTNPCMSPVTSFMHDGLLATNIGYWSIHK